jgi:hypothetical protein
VKNTVRKEYGKKFGKNKERIRKAHRIKIEYEGIQRRYIQITER